MYNKIKKAIDQNMNEDKKYDAEHKKLVREINDIAKKIETKTKLKTLSIKDQKEFESLKKQAEFTVLDLEKDFVRKKLLFMKVYMEKQLKIFDSKVKKK